MKLLFLGDIFGRSAREAIIARLPQLRRDLELDFVVANGENATQGRGITLAHARPLLEAGIDCMTLGDHAFDQKSLFSELESEPRLLRPLNIGKGAPGIGSRVFRSAKGRDVLVAVALGRVFMQPTFDDPFPMVRKLLDTHKMPAGAGAIILDFHAEATSEKNAMGHFCDGAATLVAGTHTHIPTDDARILGKGTAYVSDAGMCGDYDSVIGVHPGEPLQRYLTGMRREKFTPAEGEPTLSGVMVESDDATGLARAIAPIRIGGALGRNPD